jgi:hypothetical protein
VNATLWEHWDFVSLRESTFFLEKVFIIEFFIVCSGLVQSSAGILCVDFEVLLLVISSAFLPCSERYHSSRRIETSAGNVPGTVGTSQSQCINKVLASPCSIDDKRLIPSNSSIQNLLRNNHTAAQCTRRRETTMAPFLK